MSACNIITLEGADLSKWQQQCLGVPCITAKGKVEGRLEYFRSCKAHKPLVKKHGLKITEERKQFSGKLAEKNQNVLFYITELENGEYKITLAFHYPICFFNIGFDMSKEQVEGLKQQLFSELEETQ